MVNMALTVCGAFQLANYC